MPVRADRASGQRPQNVHWLSRCAIIRSSDTTLEDLQVRTTLRIWLTRMFYAGELLHGKLESHFVHRVRYFTGSWIILYSSVRSQLLVNFLPSRLGITHSKPWDPNFEAPSTQFSKIKTSEVKKSSKRLQLGYFWGFIPNADSLGG